MSGLTSKGAIDSKGRVVRLGAEVGRGGEGAVFEVLSSDQQLAKIYHSPLSADRAAKIGVMAAIKATHPVFRLTAWPTDVLKSDTGQPIGLIMPKVDGKDIHRLYSPKSRRSDFKRADWRFLVRAAANAARAFAAVHDVGCVIGDVNHGSILVAQDATVRLIDCDSFQVIAQNQKFLCEVGVETFTPPELQGKSFKGVIRTENHDNFGLAVMVFLMLFMGRHPFSGRYLRAGDMPIPRAIEELRFAYGVRRSDSFMERSPGTPPLSIVGDELAMLFELAFSPKMKTCGRPTAMEWAAALLRLEKALKPCPSSASHFYHGATGQCPWCQMEAATGATLFPVIAIPVGGHFDISAFWKQVETVPHPGAPPPITEAAARPSERARSTRAADVSKNWVASLTGLAMIVVALSGQLQGLSAALFFGGIAAFFVIRNMMDKSDQVRSFKPAYDDALKKWESAKLEWTRRTGAAEFEAKKAQLEKLRGEWLELPRVRAAKLDQLNRDQKEKQLEHFLDRFEIEKAKIDGMGPGRKLTLESYGFETAADIENLRNVAVPGIGPKLQRALYNWRDSVAQCFVFDPRKPVSPQDIAKIEQECSATKQKLENALGQGIADLKQTHHRIVSARQLLKPQIEAIQKIYAQAAADYNAARGM